MVRIASHRRKRYLQAAVILCLLAVLGTVFNPTLQRRALLSKIGPLVDHVELDHVHLTPWSLTLKGLDLGYRGGVFQLDSARIAFCLSALLTRTLRLDSLSLDQLVVDLKGFEPPPKEDTPPFRGLLAALDSGFKTRIGAIRVEANLIIDPERQLDIEIRGADIAPKKTAALELALSLGKTDSTDVVDVRGNLYLKQLVKGTFLAIGADLLAEIHAQSLPQSERIRIKAVVSEGFTPLRSAHGSSMQTSTAINQERIQIGLYVPGEGADQRSVVGVAGTYDGNVGRLRARYQVAANDALIAPYVADRELPTLNDWASGRVEFDLVNMTGAASIENVLRVAGIAEWIEGDRSLNHVTINSTASVALNDNQLLVHRFDTQGKDDADNDWISIHAPEELRVDLGEPSAFLGEKQTLLEVIIDKLPLAWLGQLSPNHQVTGGVLNGAFQLKSEGDGVLGLVPTTPLQASGVGLLLEGRRLPVELSVSTEPRVSVAPSGIKVDIDKLLIQAGDTRLGETDLHLSMPKQEQREMHLETSGELQVNDILRLFADVDQSTYPLPKGLSLGYQGALVMKEGGIEIQRLQASLAQGEATEFLGIALRKPFSLALEDTEQAFKNPLGEVARITINDLKLSWLSAFFPDLTLSGDVSAADLSISADGGNRLNVVAREPLKVDGFSLRVKDELVVENLGLSVDPEIAYAAEQIGVTYRELRVTSSGATLLDGGGKLEITTAEDQPMVISAQGKLDVDMLAVSLQPGITRRLGGSLDGAAHIKADYRLRHTGEVLDIGHLNVGLFQQGNTPEIELVSEKGIRLATRLVGMQQFIGAGVGSMELNATNWRPTPFAGLLAAKGLALAEVMGRASIVSDRHSITVDFVEPFTLHDVQVDGAGGPLLRPFTLKLDAHTVVGKNDIQAEITGLDMVFSGDADSAIHADLKLELDTREALALHKLSAVVTGSLPELLEQPVIMPGHSLSRADLTSSLNVYPDGKIDWQTEIANIEGGKPLAIHGVKAPGEGTIDQNGGFSLQIPLTASGESGISEAQIKARYAGQGEGNLLSIDVDGQRLYLNDLLATLEGIQGKIEEAADTQAGADEEETVSSTRTVVDNTADPKAFWDLLPYDTQVDFRLTDLFYSDYLVFNDLKGSVALGADRFGIDDFVAHFHDSPLRFQGELRFNAGSNKPYGLKVDGDVSAFDLNQFFTELVPGKKPRVEGIFGVEFELSGDSPNLAQFRNNFFMDLSLQSRSGVFRPLPPDSLLLAGTSGVLGVVGEGVSFVPTGGFGVGVVSRLVAYIKEIEYDTIDIRVVRDHSRDLVIQQCVMQSPSVLMSATGRVDYEDGVDILDSPLTLAANLDMRGKGASILYSLGLLQHQRDQWGYWQGPEFKVWGTPSDAESNLSEIIRKAGKGTLQGGVTRPFAGLVGNVKYRWFDDGPPTAVPDQEEEDEN